MNRFNFITGYKRTGYQPKLPTGNSELAKSWEEFIDRGKELNFLGYTDIRSNDSLADFRIGYVFVKSATEAVLLQMRMGDISRNPRNPPISTLLSSESGRLELIKLFRTWP